MPIALEFSKSIPRALRDRESSRVEAARRPPTATLHTHSAASLTFVVMICTWNAAQRAASSDCDSDVQSLHLRPMSRTLCSVAAFAYRCCRRVKCIHTNTARRTVKHTNMLAYRVRACAMFGLSSCFKATAAAYRFGQNAAGRVTMTT